MVLLKKVGSDHAKLRQLMLVEEFKWCINSDVRAFLNKKEVENLDVAARLADDYSLTHKASFVTKPFPRKPFNPQLKGSLTFAMGKCLWFSVKIKVCQSSLSSH